MMQIVLEFLPIIVLVGCLVFLCIKIKTKGFLFVISLIYLGMQVVYKIIHGDFLFGGKNPGMVLDLAVQR